MAQRGFPWIVYGAVIAGGSVLLRLAFSFPWWGSVVVAVLFTACLGAIEYVFRDDDEEDDDGADDRGAEDGDG